MVNNKVKQEENSITLDAHGFLRFYTYFRQVSFKEIPFYSRSENTEIIVSVKLLKVRCPCIEDAVGDILSMKGSGKLVGKLEIETLEDP